MKETVTRQGLQAGDIHSAEEPYLSVNSRNFTSVSSLTWCSIPSASRRAISGLTPSTSKSSPRSDDARGSPAPAFRLLPSETRRATGSSRSNPLTPDVLTFWLPLAGNPQPRGHIDLTCFANLTNQIGDQFHIVINQLPAMRFTHLTEPFYVLFNIHQLRRFFVVGLPARRFIVLPQWGDASSVL